MTAPLTRADIDQALAALGCPSTIDDRTTCPHCEQDGALTISQNGGPEPHLACAHGCEEASVRAMVVAAVRQARRSGSFDPLDRVRAALDMPGITRIVKHGRGHAYVLELGDGTSVDLGTTADLFVRRRMEAAILATARVMIPTAKTDAHRQLVADIEAAADEIGDALSVEEETLSLLVEYLDAHNYARHVDLDDKANLWDVLYDGGPFMTVDGRLHIRLEKFTDWCRRMGQRMTRQEMSQRLGRLGFVKPDEGGRIDVRRGEKKIQRKFWVSPADFEGRL